MHIVSITPIPTPYRDPFWQVLSEQPGIKVTVIYCSSGRDDRPWSIDDQFGFRREFPLSLNLALRSRASNSCYYTPGLSHLLTKLNPSVVLTSGYNHFTMFQAARFAKTHKVPWLMMTESWKVRKGFLGVIKHKAISHWLNSARGALPTGSWASAHLERLGVGLSRQIMIPNVPDVEKLWQQAEEHREDLAGLRMSLNIPQVPLIISVGRLVSKKRPLELVEAFAKVHRQQPSVLALLGTGPLLAEVNALANRLGVAPFVRTPGFVQTKDLVRWLAASNLFVLPSSETWGVAPIEALACGIPTLVSDETGCGIDALVNPKVGGVLPAKNTDSWEASILKYLRQETSPREIHKEWSICFKQYRYKRLAKSLVVGLEEII